MKKAKEYAADFVARVGRGEDPVKCAGDVARAMTLEIEDIGKMRHAKSSEALTAIVLEQSRKWKAFVARVPEKFSLSPSGFALYFKTHMEATAKEMPVDVLNQML